jgi:hypothetical protein
VREPVEKDFKANRLDVSGLLKRKIQNHLDLDPNEVRYNLSR